MNDEQLAQYFRFLDQLRASGAVNMHGARSHLVEEFGLSRADAGEILTTWFKVELRAPIEARIASARRMGL